MSVIVAPVFTQNLFMSHSTLLLTSVGIVLKGHATHSGIAPVQVSFSIKR